MLVICHGITKSGSTLAFELVKGILETGGHPQTRLPDIGQQHSINFIQPLNRTRLRQLLPASGDTWVALKTHAGLSDPIYPEIEKLLEQGVVRVIASYRDPREVCLSLVDAGTRARSRGRKEFSEFTDIASTIPSVQRQLEKFRKWGSLSGVLCLNYDLVAFSADAAVDRIEAYLGVTGDRARAKRYAFDEAFTQRNKGVRQRARQELSPEQYAELTETFADFIRNVCENEDPDWFAKGRPATTARPASRVRAMRP